MSPKPLVVALGLLLLALFVTPRVALAAWPDADQQTRLVFITCDLDPRTIADLFNAFMGASSPDAPDRAALVDNPLVPFGGIDR